MEKATKDLVVRVQQDLFDRFREKCDANYKTISEVIRDYMSYYAKGGSNMFEKIEGPSKKDIVAAADSITKNAMANESKIRCKREHTTEGDTQWVLMNEGAKWLADQGLGKFLMRTTEFFDFEVTFG